MGSLWRQTMFGRVAVCAGALLCFALWPLHASAVDAGKTPPYSYSWDSLKTCPVPQWFDEPKLGISIHWGPQSLWNSPWGTYQNPAKSYPAIKDKFGATPPEFGYKDVIPMFKAEEWDPEAWADLFKQAGARYVIFPGEHHDGFHMGDSALLSFAKVM